MSDERAMVLREAGEIQPAQQMRRASDVAGVCREIVKRTVKRVGNKDYVCVEGWQSIATAHGCVASVELVEAVDGGVRAVASLKRASDGAELARAEGFVGDDEKTWASRPLYARRAMAQTRAISRVCRSAFAHVVVLIDNNLSTTPAEEMDGIEEHSAPAPVQRQPRAPRTVDAEIIRDDLSDAGRETPQGDGTEVWRGVLCEVKTKEGVSAKGRPWKVYMVRTDSEQRCSTFDEELGEQIKDSSELETPLDLMVRPGRKAGEFDLVKFQPHHSKEAA